MMTVDLAESAYVDSLGLDDGFGDWLAGFIDGEGSFNIRRASRVYLCMDTAFTIHLRDDDAEILAEIRRRLGIGKLIYRPNNRYTGAKPVAGWSVQGRMDCQRLCAVLDVFPLRAKKAGDYAIWRQAVSLWVSWPSGAARPPEEWAKIADLRDELSRYRQYRDSGLWS